MNKKLYIITGIVFILCVVGGFIIAKKMVVNTLESSDVAKPDTTTIVNKDTIPESGANDEPAPGLNDGPQVQQEAPVPVVPTTKPQLTNEELTAIINDLSNRNYPRNVTLKYNNLDPEREEGPTSIADIRNCIQLEMWKSVTVTNATFDNNNNVTSITMTINREI